MTNNAFHWHRNTNIVCQSSDIWLNFGQRCQTQTKLNADRKEKKQKSLTTKKSQKKKTKTINQVLGRPSQSYDSHHSFHEFMVFCNRIWFTIWLHSLLYSRCAGFSDTYNFPPIQAHWQLVNRIHCPATSLMVNQVLD